MKLSEIKYVRPNKEEVLAHLASIKERMQNAHTLLEFYDIHEEYKAYDEDIGTNMRIAFIRFTQDTRDEFYAAEQDYLDEIGPEINVANAEIANCYLTSPFRAELEKRFPPVMFVNMQMAVDANDPRIVADRVEASKIGNALYHSNIIPTILEGHL